jgi:uncharacterized protein (DUF1697 family)
MNTYIALFRGINVGGKNILKMKDLDELLETLGAQQVKTYVQSGNVVLQSMEAPSQLSEKINQAVQEEYGFATQVLLLTQSEFEDAIRRNPFPQAESFPKTMHLGFLVQESENPKLIELEQLKASGEEFLLKGKVFYLHAPNGIGRSKLAEKIEKHLGVPMTMRNWNTVCKLSDIVITKEIE